jgi:hypothetical protein
MRSWLKNTVFSFLRLIGIAAYVSKPSYHYVPDYFGKSAHKQKDIRTLPVFGELAMKVITSWRSSLYYDRLFTIYQIISRLGLFNRKGQPMNLAEVGVYKGGTSFFMASLAEQLNLPLHLYCFDTFEGHAAEDINKSVEIAHVPGTFNDTSFEAVKSYLSQFKNVDIYKGRFQDTSPVLDDAPMHFVHLDMDIYEPTIFALRFFSERLVAGGVMLLDDYGFETCPGIEKAVKEFSSENADYFGIPLMSGQYMFVKINEEKSAKDK